jgi:phosphomannomutase
MISLVAFDLDGTLALSKQPLQPPMTEALTSLLTVANVAVISGGDWPQFEKQVASRLPPTANLKNLWLMPTTGTKLYTWRTESGSWQPVYAELFTPEKRASIIEDRGSGKSDYVLRSGPTSARPREGSLGS